MKQYIKALITLRERIDNLIDCEITEALSVGRINPKAIHGQIESMADNEFAYISRLGYIDSCNYQEETKNNN